jgi:hypothetical protein
MLSEDDIEGIGRMGDLEGPGGYLGQRTTALKFKFLSQKIVLTGAGGNVMCMLDRASDSLSVSWESFRRHSAAREEPGLRILAQLTNGRRSVIQFHSDVQNDMERLYKWIKSTNSQATISPQHHKVPLSMQSV